MSDRPAAKQVLESLSRKRIERENFTVRLDPAVIAGFRKKVAGLPYSMSDIIEEFLIQFCPEEIEAARKKLESTRKKTNDSK